LSAKISELVIQQLMKKKIQEFDETVENLTNRLDDKSEKVQLSPRSDLASYSTLGKRSHHQTKAFSHVIDDFFTSHLMSSQTSKKDHQMGLIEMR